MCLKPTADMCDLYGDDYQVLETQFQTYGKKKSMEGICIIAKVEDDNSLVKNILMEYGKGLILIIDNNFSSKCALLGGNLALQASHNQWEGIVVLGCIRDVEEINGIDICIKCTGTNPRKSINRNSGLRDVPLLIKNCIIRPQAHIVADADGVIVQVMRE